MVVSHDPGSVLENWKPLSEENLEAGVSTSEDVPESIQALGYCRYCRNGKPPRCHHCSVFLNLAFALSLLCFIIMHASLLSTNTTSVEVGFYEKKGVVRWKYDLGRKKNFEQVPENELVRADMLNASYDGYHRVIANIKDDMDENVFAARLQASIPIEGAVGALVKPLKICSPITPPSYASLMWKYVPWSITCDKPMLVNLTSSMLDGVFSILHDSCNRAFSVSNINSFVEMTDMATKLLKDSFLKALQ
ncbi:hypothetical protein Tco_0882619 [Tanacetum coccineum]